MVDICENGLSFDGMLIVGAVAEVLKLLKPEERAVELRLRKLQKSLKYGLASASSISFYEVGFADRVIAMEMSILTSFPVGRTDIVQKLGELKEEVRTALLAYPGYFSGVAENLASSAV